jgi:predicted GIY-YIG superfamily endonuclease
LSKVALVFYIEGCPPKQNRMFSEGGHMYFVYKLQSDKFPNEFYVGYTTDIKKRLAAHNNGQVPHTSKFKPWKMIFYFAISNKDKALEFEKYLKSGSGRAFLKKHLI